MTRIKEKTKPIRFLAVSIALGVAAKGVTGISDWKLTSIFEWSYMTGVVASGNSAKLSSGMSSIFSWLISRCR